MLALDNQVSLMAAAAPAEDDEEKEVVQLRSAYEEFIEDLDLVIACLEVIEGIKEA